MNSRLTQNHVEHLISAVQCGKMTTDEANVEKVRMARVVIVTSAIPRGTRRALNAAVKLGYLGHWMRDGKKPEVYYHPDFDYLAAQDLARHVNEINGALAAIVARPGE